MRNKRKAGKSREAGKQKKAETETQRSAKLHSVETNDNNNPNQEPLETKQQCGNLRGHI